VPVWDASPHGLTRLDPPLPVAIVRPDYRRRSANYDRLICQHGGNPQPWKSPSSVVRHSMLVGGPLNDGP